MDAHAKYSIQGEKMVTTKNIIIVKSDIKVIPVDNSNIEVNPLNPLVMKVSEDSLHDHIVKSLPLDLPSVNYNEVTIRPKKNYGA